MAEPLQVTVRMDTSGFTETLTRAQSRQVTLAGVKAGIKILQRSARSSAPRRRGSGALKQSQGTVAKKGKKGKTVSFAVQGARKGFEKMVTPKGYTKPQRAVPAFYDHLVQGGTRPHRLGKGENLERMRRGRVAKRSSAQLRGGTHPGTTPNPYRKRAYEAVKDQIGAAVMAAMKEKLIVVVAKARGM